MPTDPKKSEGARLERRAFREYLRRQLQKAPPPGGILLAALDWVLKRQDRYDGRAGGLGRK